MVRQQGLSDFLGVFRILLTSALYRDKIILAMDAGIQYLLRAHIHKEVIAYAKQGKRLKARGASAG